MGLTSRDLRPQDIVPLATAGEPPKPSSATLRLRVQSMVNCGGSVNMSTTEVPVESPLSRYNMGFGIL